MTKTFLFLFSLVFLLVLLSPLPALSVNAETEKQYTKDDFLNKFNKLFNSPSLSEDLNGFINELCIDHGSSSQKFYWNNQPVIVSNHNWTIKISLRSWRYTFQKKDDSEPPSIQPKEIQDYRSYKLEKVDTPIFTGSISCNPIQVHAQKENWNLPLPSHHACSAVLREIKGESKGSFSKKVPSPEKRPRNTLTHSILPFSFHLQNPFNRSEYIEFTQTNPSGSLYNLNEAACSFWEDWRYENATQSCEKFQELERTPKDEYKGTFKSLFYNPYDTQSNSLRGSCSQETGFDRAGSYISDTHVRFTELDPHPDIVELICYELSRTVDRCTSQKAGGAKVYQRTQKPLQTESPGNNTEVTPSKTHPAR